MGISPGQPPAAGAPVEAWVLELRAVMHLDAAGLAVKAPAAAAAAAVLAAAAVAVGGAPLS